MQRAAQPVRPSRRAGSRAARGLLVATLRPVPGGRVVQDDLEFQIVDRGEEAAPVSLATRAGRDALRQIIERPVLIRALRCGRYWTLDSPRILWEREPFRKQDGIAAFRRFSISAIAIDGVGIGVAVDASTSFLSADSLAWYFPLAAAEAEGRRRRLAFERLSGRLDGQKGTLVYEGPRGAHRCYFEEALPGVTCSTTGRMVLSGRTYGSLGDYYRKNHPGMVFTPDGPVVRVSFPGLPDTNLVAAERARARASLAIGKPRGRSISASVALA